MRSPRAIRVKTTNVATSELLAGDGNDARTI